LTVAAAVWYIGINPNKESMKTTLDQVRHRFRERGLKITPQRTAIYQALIDSRTHPTAEELYRAVKRLHPSISPNTVYYTLGALRAAGLAHEVNYWRDRSRFDGNLALHHHLICLGCRRIEDLADESLDRLAVSKRHADFEVLGHRVEFHGYCAACRRRRTDRRRSRQHNKPHSHS
jgi:Fur family peroxide stress response transcriptional regulator